MSKATNRCITKSDTTLEALGRKLDLIIRKHDASVRVWAPLWAEQERRLQEFRSANPGCTNNELSRAYERIAEELEKDASEPHPDYVFDRSATELFHAIMRAPANSINGLAIKAKLAAFMSPNLWDETDSDADFGDLCVRKLIDSILNVSPTSNNGAGKDFGKSPELLRAN